MQGSYCHCITPQLCFAFSIELVETMSISKKDRESNIYMSPVVGQMENEILGYFREQGS